MSIPKITVTAVGSSSVSGSGNTIRLVSGDSAIIDLDPSLLLTPYRFTLSGDVVIEVDAVTASPSPTSELSVTLGKLPDLWAERVAMARVQADRDERWLNTSDARRAAVAMFVHERLLALAEDPLSWLPDAVDINDKRQTVDVLISVMVGDVDEVEIQMLLGERVERVERLHDLVTMFRGLDDGR